MKKSGISILFVLFLFGFLACTGEKHIQSAAAQKTDCSNAAYSTQLAPKFPAEYYKEQGIKYFMTMQSDMPASVIPNYSDMVIRWEWPPWLLLTGFKKNNLISTDLMLKLNPTRYNLLDCKTFEKQPFCRCHVVFNYGGTPCPIYEEFSFNNQGEITFIEAWSDYESLLPMGPGEDGTWDESEYWGMKEVNRLSSKIPGLGNENGRIDLASECIIEAAQKDNDVAELLKRINDPINSWLKQTVSHQREVKNGCDAPKGDVYPYYH